MVSDRLVDCVFMAGGFAKSLPQCLPVRADVRVCCGGADTATSD